MASITTERRMVAVAILLVAFAAGVACCSFGSVLVPEQKSPRRLLTSLDPTQVVTNPARTQNVATYCKVPRSMLISDEDRKASDQYGQFMKAKFNVDSMLVMPSMLSLDLGGIVTVLPSDVKTNYWMNVAPFAIGLVVAAILWPFLLCCCACPSKCPMRRCQQPDYQPYTKCELLWPPIALLIVLTIACVASIPGFIQAAKVSDGLRSAECAISMLTDDIMNGNLTNDNSSFWMGTVLLSQQFANLSLYLPTLGTGLTAVQTSLTTLLTSTATAEVAIATFPTGTMGAPFSLVYTDPTPRTPTGTSVTSSFGAVLGTSTVGGTLCGNLFQSVDALQTSMTAMGTAMTGFPAISTQMASDLMAVASSLTSLASSIQIFDSVTGILYANLEIYLRYVNISLTVFYAMVFGLAGVTALGGCCMILCKKDRFRYVMYGACSVMAIVAFLGMIVSLVIAFVLPFLYIGCAAVSTAVTNQASFQTLAAQFSLPTDMSNALLQCIPGGTGSLYESFGTAGTSLKTEFTSAFTLLNQFTTNSVYDSTSITNSQAAITPTVTSYVLSASNDIAHDAPSLAWLKGLANQTEPAACAGDAVFTLDSLVPSTDPNSLSIIPCAPGKSVVTCTGTPPTMSCPNGCLDLNSIMLAAGSLANFQAIIGVRYATANALCQAALQTDLATYYNQWYTPMSSTSTGIASVLARWTAGASPTITAVTTDLSPVKSGLVAALDALNANVTKISDPINGLQGGVNCLLLADDLQRIRDTVCINLFNALFVSLLTVGVSSFSLLLAMCCIVFTGVRYYKQAETAKWEQDRQGSKAKTFPKRQEAMMNLLIGKLNTNRTNRKGLLEFSHDESI